MESTAKPPHPGAPAPGQRLPLRNILADDVYAIIRDDLLAGRIAPGSRLNLDSLARELHVSNTPVRQALARLESEGLVTKEPYRGFAASRLLDTRTISELYDYRLILEPTTAAMAAQQSATAPLTATLDQLCDTDQVRELLDSGSVSDLAQRDVDFHTEIARIAGNQVIVENLTLMMTRMRLYSAYDRYGAGEHAWDEHRSIAQAVKEGDPKAAADAMRSHLRGALSRIRSSPAAPAGYS